MVTCVCHRQHWLLIIQLQMKAGAEDDSHPRRRSLSGRLLLIAARNGRHCCSDFFHSFCLFTCEAYLPGLQETINEAHKHITMQGGSLWREH